MLDVLIYLLLIATICVAFSMFLDNALGYPGSQFPENIDTGAILFFWTLLLSELRLTQVKGANFMEDIANTVTGFDNQQEAKKVLQQTVVTEARVYFSIERALGMCIYCTNFWVCMAVSTWVAIADPFKFYDFPRYALFLIIPFLSHLILKHANRTGS